MKQRKEIVTALVKAGRKDLAAHFVGAGAEQQLSKIHSQLEKQLQAANKVILKMKPRNTEMEAAWRKLDRAIDDFGYEIQLLDEE